MVSNTEESKADLATLAVILRKSIEIKLVETNLQEQLSDHLHSRNKKVVKIPRILPDQSKNIYRSKSRIYATFCLLTLDMFALSVTFVRYSP